jgi:rhamnose transport system ATP-binding protein
MNLSGGNQQKVVLGKWLARNAELLILDEPTRGIDVGAKSEIHKIIGNLAASGIAIVMISSELPEILGISDRIVVIHEGELTAELDYRDATEQSILLAAMGLQA